MMELKCVLPLNVLIVAASGNLGSTVTRYAINANHNVSVLVRSKENLQVALTHKILKKIRNVFIGDCLDVDIISAAIEGQDCVIECLGNDVRPAAIDLLIQTIINANCPNFVALGGAQALLLPDGSPAGPALGMQPLADLHLNTLNLLRASNIQFWTQVCPTRMTKSPNKKESQKFVIRPNVVDLDMYAQGVELYYEDVALAIVNAIDVSASGYDKSQIAFKLIESFIVEVERT